jgi:hypothetical protein
MKNIFFKKLENFMKTFKDNAGRNWAVSVNIATVKRVKSLLEVDLLEAVEGKLVDRLIIDPILLCDIVYVICKSEADSQNISDEQFGQAMAGDAIEQATEALLQELVEFFPESKRPALRKALGKFQQLQAKAMEFTLRYLDNPEIDRKMEQDLEKIINSSGNSPESPG